MKLWIVLFFNIGLICKNAYPNENMGDLLVDGPSGTRVPHIQKDADICQVSNLTSDVIAPYIDKHLVEINKLDEVIETNQDYSRRTAQEILAVSHCFQLDPLVFTSLVGHESHFYHNSVSHTGAIGLGQLTGIGLREISQQLHANFVPTYERGSQSALEYFEEGISCVEASINAGQEFKHWWMFPDKASWMKELKSNTLLNLTYAAIIYKISFSKMISYFNSTSKTVDKNTSLSLKMILNYYNGASEAEKLKHYRKTRKKMNDILKLLDDRSNKCFEKSLK